MAESTHPPGVMVSSTFYDLRQVREDLRSFLEDELGYRPLLSEHPSFPVNPDATTIDNCRERVERDADILVLVIGGKYGSIDDQTSKSVTNLEYLAARQKGIPVYAFVEQGIVSFIPVWKATPTGDFSAVVDTTKLFEFIDQVRSIDRVWMREFKHASDVVDALRIQFAYQHRDGLLLQNAIRNAGDQRWISQVHGETLRIALEKPTAWEYRLFAHALVDALRQHDRLRRRYEAGIPLSTGEDVNDAMKWISARFADAQRMLDGLNTLVGQTLQEALGPPGTSGDTEKIIFVAEAMGEVYADSLRWSARIAAANIEAKFKPLSLITSNMMGDVIRQIKDFAVNARERFDLAAASASPSSPQVITVKLTLTMPDSIIDQFNAEIASLKGGDGAA